jgi:hypothetical protein
MLCHGRRIPVWLKQYIAQKSGQRLIPAIDEINSPAKPALLAAAHRFSRNPLGKKEK